MIIHNLLCTGAKGGRREPERNVYRRQGDDVMTKRTTEDAAHGKEGER